MSARESPPESGIDPAGLVDRCAFPLTAAPLPLAVSGGPDSVALVLLAHRAGLDFEIWHVDHGLRPDSAADAAMVGTLAAGFGVPFHQRRVEIAPGSDLEARARRARYAALPSDVCVGHTADDRAETVLLNLFRGAGPAGVAAPYERVNRPIIGLRRCETRALCAVDGVTVIDDAMNHDPAFTRVDVRTRVLPLLADVFGRDPVPLLDRHADLVADALEVVRAAAAEIDPTSAVALRAAPRAVAAEAVRSWLQRETGAAHPVDAGSVDRVLAVARNERIATEVVGGHRVARTAGVLRVEDGAASATREATR